MCPHSLVAARLSSAASSICYTPLSSRFLFDCEKERKKRLGAIVPRRVQEKVTVSSVNPYDLKM